MRRRVPPTGWLIAIAVTATITVAGAIGLHDTIGGAEEDSFQLAVDSLEQRLQRSFDDLTFFTGAIGGVLSIVENDQALSAYVSAIAPTGAGSTTLESGAVEGVALLRLGDPSGLTGPNPVLPLRLGADLDRLTSGHALASNSSDLVMVPIDAESGRRYLLEGPIGTLGDQRVRALVNPAALVDAPVTDGGSDYLSVSMFDGTGGDLIRIVEGAPPTGALERTVELDAFGRRWLFEVKPGPAYSISGVVPAVATTVGFGVVISLLLWIAGMVDRRRREHHQRQVALAEELVESKDRFIASVSHELRTPLTAVHGFAELMSSMIDGAAQEIQEMARAIADQSGEMSYLIDDLLVAARSEVGAVTVLNKPVDATAVVTRLLSSLPGGAEVDVQCLNEPVVVVGDAHRIRQIVHNLISNANRHGGSRLRVEVDSTETGVIRVMDDGPPIPWQQQQRMFTAYEQLAPAVTQPASVGLGLTVARDLARLMGGDLVLRRIDGWNAFELSLPTAAGTAWAKAG